MKQRLIERMYDLISERQHATGAERDRLTAEIRKIQAILDSME